MEQSSLMLSSNKKEQLLRIPRKETYEYDACNGNSFYWNAHEIWKEFIKAINGLDTYYLHASQKRRKMVITNILQNDP